MTVITCKAQMQPLLRSGAFGNAAQVWDTFDEALVSDFPGPFSIRYKGSGAKRWWVPNIDKINLANEVLNWHNIKI